MKSFSSLILASLSTIPLISRAELAPHLVQRQSSAATGDRQCGSSMCVSATKNGTTVSYVLESKSGTPGWMAMGIGSQMAGATMFILWQNTNGIITLSQRKGAGEFMPEVDPNPALVATVDNSLSATSGTVKYAFTLPADSTAKQGIIYAFSRTNPGSSAADATLVQHIDRGTLTLDLNKASTSSPTTGSDGYGGSGSNGSNNSDPNSDSQTTNLDALTPWQRMVVAHAVMSLVGFLLLLPAGVLLARYFRTSTSKWFLGHWLIQFLISGPVILVGFILGITAVSQSGAMHVNDAHKKWGIVLFALYVVQCSLGAFIHFIKLSKSGRRPPQNYLHAILGLTIIGLALFQVRSGYHEEWPKFTGRIISNAANIIWFVWVVLLPVLYVIGLAFLPRQFKQEAESRYRARRKEGSDTMLMRDRY